MARDRILQCFTFYFSALSFQAGRLEPPGRASAGLGDEKTDNQRCFWDSQKSYHTGITLRPLQACNPEHLNEMNLEVRLRSDPGSAGFLGDPPDLDVSQV